MTERLAIDGGAKVRARPYPAWPHFFEDEMLEVQKVLEEGKVNYWTGSRGREFQRRFAEYCGARHGIAVINGTAALHVALAAAKVGPGDEVIVPCRTFIATACSVLNQMAVPVFADVDLETQNIDVRSIEAQITERTKAITVVHLAGLPAEMEPIMELAARHNLVVIEDAAQAHGAEYRGRRAGNLGHVAAFSFCNDKIFTTGGEGGMVLTNDDRMAEIARSVKDHGYHEAERKSLLELESLYVYIHHRMGYNFRMTEMQAAIGLRALDKLDWNLARRRENAHYLIEKLSRLDALVPPAEPPHMKHAFYKYYVRVRPEKLRVDRDALVKAVRAEGIPVGLGTSSENYLEKVFQEQIGFADTKYPFQCPLYSGTVDYSKISLPNAKRLGKEVFVLQVHPTVQLEDLDDVVRAIEKVLTVYAK